MSETSHNDEPEAGVGAFLGQLSGDIVTTQIKMRGLRSRVKVRRVLYICTTPTPQKRMA